MHRPSAMHRAWHRHFALRCLCIGTQEQFANGHTYTQLAVTCCSAIVAIEQTGTSTLAHGHTATITGAGIGWHLAGKLASLAL